MKREPKINIQALARKDKGLMSCLVSDPGMQTVSVDAVAGEPTITCHFSRDPMYKYACFDGVGKAPYFNPQGVLMIDDIYLMTASVSPIGSEAILDAFHNARYDEGRTFADQWLVDAEVVKKNLKKLRFIHKILCLGLGYSLGPKQMVEHARVNGYKLSLADAKKFFKVYWALFAQVRTFGNYLEKRLAEDGHIINPFGYRLIPDPSYKALNYFIQSSLSGVMHALGAKFFGAAPDAHLKSVIHDEFVFDIPIGTEDFHRTLMNDSVKSLNSDLKWSINVRTGWAVGPSWWEAH